MDERPMSVAQVAERWGCSRQSVYNLINKGALPAFRVGTLTRIRQRDLSHYEDSQCRDPEPPHLEGRVTSVVLQSPEAPLTPSMLSPGYLAGLRSMQKKQRNG